MIDKLPCDKCVGCNTRDRCQEAFEQLSESQRLLGIHYRAYRTAPTSEISRVCAANLCKDVEEQAKALREALLGAEEVTR